VTEAPCKLWDGPVHQRGYGIHRSDGTQELAHRWVWKQAHGPIPPGVKVRHTCLDTPLCVELTHLRRSTPKELTAAIAATGRLHDLTPDVVQPTAEQRARGERHGNAKLTEADIPTIRQRRRAGETLTVIAADYGVTHVLISQIARGVAWKHVPDSPPKT
jgi:hypothetical protein